MRALALVMLICWGSTFAFGQPALPPVNEWSVYKNERFGFRLVYPDLWFDARPESPNGDGRVFVTPDGQARIVVIGAHNSEGLSLRDYRAALLRDFGGYDDLTYSPIGRTWFVLSGFRGDRIYYQKVMFSCAGQIVNVLSIDLPAQEKPRYAPMIEEIEDRFRPGQGADTPVGCG